MSEAATVDGFLGGRLSIAQPARGAHRAGLDAVLLAAALGPGTAGHVVELGAGVGVSALSVLHRCEETTATLVEIDEPTAEFAARNVATNGFAARASVIVADVTAPEAERMARGLPPDHADHVIANPPFHPTDRTRRSPSPDRARAHALDPNDLDGWIRTAASLLKPSGTLTLIYRADDLPRLLAAIGRRFGSITILPIHPEASAAASRILLRGRPQGRAPLRLLPGFVLHDPSGGWLTPADAVLHGAPLPVTWW